jgi:integrase
MMLLKDFLQNDYRRLRDISAATLKTYTAAIHSVEKHLGRAATLEDLIPTTINDWLTALLDTTGRETVYSYRRHVLTIWRAAEELEILKLGPRRIKPIRRPARIIEGYSTDDMGKLLDATKRVRRWLWWRVFLQMAWYSGLRLSDVLAVERKWIFHGPEGTGLLSVIQQKTGQQISKTLPAELMADISDLVEPGQRIVCPLWCRREAFFRAFKRLTRKAGLPAGTAKWIRRGSASEAEKLSAGAGPVHLGHSRGSGTTIFNQSYRCDRIIQPKIVMPPTIGGGGRKDRVSA